MRTALLETATTKLMQLNDKNNFVAAKVFSLQNESWKWIFWERILLSRRIAPCRTTSSAANSLRKQRKKNNFLRRQQANRRSWNQLFRINCSMINLWNKQTVLRRNFVTWEASKNSSWAKSKKIEEENKVRSRYKCFLRVYRVSGRS